MRPTATLLSLIVATGVFATAASLAQEPSTTAPASSTATSTATSMSPARGSTMESVRAKFGAPSQEEPAVGRPPITRWDYPGYVVFFENDRVLHTVIVKS